MRAADTQHQTLSVKSVLFTASRVIDSLNVVFASDHQRSTLAHPLTFHDFDSQMAPVGRIRRAVTKRSVRKAGSVGGSRMMECDIVYPGGRYMERIITWRKHGIEVRNFSKYNNLTVESSKIV